MQFERLIDARRRRFEELESAISDPALFDDPKKASETLREHRRIKETLELWDTISDFRRQLEENRKLAGDDDPEIAEMAAMEIEPLEERIPSLETELQYALLPRNPAEDRDALVEIRAGTGGDEASLFAGDLMRMYQRFAERRGWKWEMLEARPSEVGGFKEVILKISGDEVFRYLKYESGVHRVQRVPTTEAQGRIHTSTATVAVMPEAEEVDVQIHPDDLRIEVCRAGGAGGQHVNRTESAVQVFHLPTGLMVRCEDGRSQGKNKEKALQILRARLFERRQREIAESYSAQRRSLIGSGERSEKIRTYNFPQSRMTDHRIGLTTHALQALLDGDMDEVGTALQQAEIAERLAEAEE
jgi:peptide chain release factor 1